MPAKRSARLKIIAGFNVPSLPGIEQPSRPVPQRYQVINVHLLLASARRRTRKVIQYQPPSQAGESGTPGSLTHRRRGCAAALTRPGLLCYFYRVA